MKCETNNNAGNPKTNKNLAKKGQKDRDPNLLPLLPWNFVYFKYLNFVWYNIILLYALVCKLFFILSNTICVKKSYTVVVFVVFFNAWNCYISP